MLRPLNEYKNKKKNIKAKDHSFVTDYIILYNLAELVFMLTLKKFIAVVTNSSKISRFL
jgi:hypothetical protein